MSYADPRQLSNRARMARLDVVYGRQVTSTGQTLAASSSHVGAQGAQADVDLESIGLQALQHVRWIMRGRSNCMLTYRQSQEQVLGVDARGQGATVEDGQIAMLSIVQIKNDSKDPSIIHYYSRIQLSDNLGCPSRRTNTPDTYFEARKLLDRQNSDSEKLIIGWCLLGG
jgi:hypothetical protein